VTGSQVALVTTTLLGQVITGGIVSGFTVTVKQHTGPGVPDGGVEQHTVVIPRGKVLPDSGEHVKGRVPPVHVSTA
jgi:hypothetical protein